MKFNEAMEALLKGSKVTRKEWYKSAYFVLEDKLVKSYQPVLKVFNYDESIMISDGWMVEGKSESMRFYDMVTYLLNGFSARLNNWKPEAYIKYDAVNKYIVLFDMDVFPYVPDFDAFIADDWIIV